MEAKNLELEYDEIQLFGQRLVKTLCVTLRYVDGHEDDNHLPSSVHLRLSGDTIVLRQHNTESVRSGIC